MTRTVARLAFSVATLLVVARLVDVGEVLARLSSLHAGWVTIALAIAFLQVPLLAWRWSFTARRLGIDLPWPTAVAEYWLGVLGNQLIPGGIGGDVSRAWRHARTDAPPREVVTAVVLERLSAQVVMTTVAVVSVLSLPWAGWPLRVGLGLVLAAVAWALLGRATRAEEGPKATLGGDARRALLDRDAFAFQFATAVLAVASYLVVFLLAARAVGVTTPIVELLPLVAPVLMTMLVPVSVAGWGIREAAAAALWGLVGLTPEDGAAISVAYGLIALVSALPGALTLLLPPDFLRALAPSADPGRTGRPDPE